MSFGTIGKPTDIEHPEVTMARGTGYPSWQQPSEYDLHCCECGEIISDDEDSYECRTHAVLCLECLKMLHKRYV